MVSPMDRENIEKAAQCASLLLGDVQALARSEDALLAELGQQALEGAANLEQRLQRLAAITSPQG